MCARLAQGSPHLINKHQCKSNVESGGQEREGRVGGIKEEEQEDCGKKWQMVGQEGRWGK